MGRLERHLDADLIVRIENGWKPNSEALPLKRQKPPRPAWSYRGIWKNAHRENTPAAIASATGEQP